MTAPVEDWQLTIGFDKFKSAPRPIEVPLDTDRNLLFGVVALQADLLDADQFIQACTLWTTRKEFPLADMLVELGWLTAEDKSDVERLLDRKLKKHPDSLKNSLAAVTDNIKRSLAALGDADIHHSLAGLPEAKSSVLQTVDHVPSHKVRYTLTRLHATGGIGRVWLATDHELGREVALKELRPERADDARLWARFLQEARVTGQLEHPGIVPVYELAQRPEGLQPYYTMRFVRGRTLSDAATDFHKKRQAGQAGTFEILDLLNAFVTVCNTVAYAHSRGIIHRDLKGPNVILGDFGDVVVLDWGLAKVLGKSESAPETLQVALELPATGSDLTVHGQVIGTPAYMAPEQAAGESAQLDERTDVYGLGAMLYEILTGLPPFVGEATEEVLRKVREEEPVPPHQVWPDVPKALESVCLRALSKKPADRYASATEPGHDVQVWQDVQRRQAEEALRRQTAILQSVLQSMADGVIVTEKSGDFILWNYAAEQLTGNRPTNMPLSEWSERFGCRLPDGKTPYPDNDLPLSRAMRGESVDDAEVFLQNPNKPEGVLLSTNARPLRNEQGELQGGVIVIRDITDRRRAETALKDSEALYHTLVESLPFSIFRKDLEGRFIFGNQRFFETMSKPPDKVMGKSDFDLVSPTLAEKYCRDDRRVIETGEVLEDIEEHQIAGGETRYIQIIKSAVQDAKGQVIGTQGIYWDVTERKKAEIALRESEERYRSVIAAMQDGITLLNADGTIYACNSAAERILGLSADQIMGRTPYDPRWRAIHEDGSPFPGDTHPPIVTLRTGKPCFDVVMGIHKPDGPLSWISINSQPLKRANEIAPYAVVASFEDITERKRRTRPFWLGT
jgi:PAS domain S-box-containing protein